MEKKKGPRGRKPKIHKPVDASFDEVLGAIASSKYKDKKTLKKRKKL
jgi:hypothetical protein